MRRSSLPISSVLITAAFLLLFSACSNDAESEQTATQTNEDSTTSSTGEATQEADVDDAAANSGFPETDIYLARMLYRSGSVSIGDPENITGRNGYDNQPFFMPDNDTILFSSRHDLDQTDLFSYRISSEQITQLTATPESEYSPTLAPDQKTVSTVRVEMDGMQRLWEFPIAAPLGGITADNEVFDVVFPEVLGVGYHGWLDKDNAYVFIVDQNGEQHRLSKASRVEAGSREVTRKIGRSIRKIPETNNISYIAKDDPNKWYVVELDTQSGKSKVLTETVSGSEDLVWLDKDNLIMARKGRIYHKDLNKDQDWKAFSVNSMEAVEGEITRLAVSPNSEWLAFVVTAKNE